jgi:DNA polymerase-3 subunit epsilon
MSLGVALDIETTGLGPDKQRIVEIAGVVFELATGKVLGEFETLINPERNIPEDSTRIHGINSQLISAAPTFAEFGPWLVEILRDKTLVAHNAKFDVSFLNAEFARNSIPYQVDDYECTYAITRLDLVGASLAYEYDLKTHHFALEDARAAHHIYVSATEADTRRVTKEGSVFHFASMPLPFTLSRSQLGADTIQARRAISFFRKVEVQVEDAGLAYVALLNEFLEDLNLSIEEEVQLREFAATHGIDEVHEMELRVHFLNALENAALRDGTISEFEALSLNNFAEALRVGKVFSHTNHAVELPEPGSSICATGTAVVNGILYDKKTIADYLDTLGYTYTDSLSKSGEVRLLLQDSEGSQSSKVEKARRWGIPRMTIQVFIDSTSKS